jgi:soluble lytic murein transglycosylase-like protein
VAPLRFALAVFALVVPRPASADTIDRWRPLVAEAAQRFAIPEAWIERVMRAESGGNTMLGGRPIRSPKGAIGLMQLMPETWAAMRIRLGLGDDPDDPRDNILAGAGYLRMMYDRFGYPGLFAAYNAGPGRYADYLAGRARLPGETIAYLGTVTGAPRAPAITTDDPPRQLLFALRRDLGTTAPSIAGKPAADGLFAVRKDVP